VLTLVAVVTCFNTIAIVTLALLHRYHYQLHEEEYEEADKVAHQIVTYVRSEFLDPPE